MAEMINRRMSAEIEGEFVLFLIGIRINKPWKLNAWFPVLMAMPKMLRELDRKPELGLLHHRTHFGLRNAMVVQYWRSFALLDAYALSRDNVHLPAWKKFNDAVGSTGDVGIWHETYLISPGQSESIYINMPKYGIGLAGDLYPAQGNRATAAKRLRM
jgi:hypothetical protein